MAFIITKVFYFPGRTHTVDELVSHVAFSENGAIERRAARPFVKVVPRMARPVALIALALGLGLAVAQEGDVWVESYDKESNKKCARAASPTLCGTEMMQALRCRDRFYYHQSTRESVWEAPAGATVRIPLVPARTH